MIEITRISLRLILRKSIMYKKQYLHCISLIVFLLFGLCGIPQTINAGDDYMADSAFDLFDTDALVTAAAPVAESTCDPAVVAGFLIEGLDALCLLQQNLYLRTNELNLRSLLDYGLFIPYKYYCKNNDLAFHFFFQQTTRDNFTRNSTNIDTYLALFKPTLLDELARVIQNVQELVDVPIDVHAILPLFKNMTVQERRLGLMMQGIRRWDSLRFRYLIPIYYSEANFFLTPQEKEAIEEQLGINDPAEDMKFARRHLIADKFGIGDLRLNLDMHLSHIGSVVSRIGVLATIPTAFAFKKGLYGSHFEKTTKRPCLDLCTIFDLATAGKFDQLVQLGQQFAFAAIDQFSANLIDMPLGNGGHFGLGIYTRTKTRLSTLINRPWAHNIKMMSWLSAEYLFPRQHLRYFIPTSNAPEFAAAGLLRPTGEIINQIENDPAYARATLDFLQTQIVNRIFPFVVPARVRPGMVFRWVSRYTYDAPRWGYSVGTDTWITTREKLSRLEIPACVPKNLNITIAQKPFTYQAGVMGTVFWKHKKNFLLSLNAEYNATSIGIGSDWMVSIAFEKLF
jgi:hypothetical protein